MYQSIYTFLQPNAEHHLQLTTEFSSRPDIGPYQLSHQMHPIYIANFDAFKHQLLHPTSTLYWGYYYDAKLDTFVLDLASAHHTLMQTKLALLDTLIEHHQFDPYQTDVSIDSIIYRPHNGILKMTPSMIRKYQAQLLQYEQMLSHRPHQIQM